jgi:hypothetical protein
MTMKTSMIFTTGAFLYPLRTKDETGVEIWRWAVASFEDDTYSGGKICSPVENAETCENLLLPDGE